jgi:hypothetical protein
VGGGLGSPLDTEGLPELNRGLRVGYKAALDEFFVALELATARVVSPPGRRRLAREVSQARRCTRQGTGSSGRNAITARRRRSRARAWTRSAHGPRRVFGRSGDGFLTGDFVDTLHAQAQAVWGVRRLVGWLRANQATAIGLYGISLGAYTSALVASLEDDLSCVIAGIPPPTSCAWYAPTCRPC